MSSRNSHISFWEYCVKMSSKVVWASREDYSVTLAVWHFFQAPERLPLGHLKELIEATLLCCFELENVFSPNEI